MECLGAVSQYFYKINISQLTTVSTVSLWPSPDSIQARGCPECFGLRDHIRMLESADAEANKVGSTGEILRSITSYTHNCQCYLQ